MGVAFYLQNSRFWNSSFHREHYRLGIPVRDFEVIRDLLDLESPLGDNTGDIAPDPLLMKIAKARIVLQQRGAEWERSEEPPPEGQEDQSLKVLGTPGLDQSDLNSILETLKRISLYAKENDTGVKWS